MPKIDWANAVPIPSPTTQETVISTPALPGFEVRIPAGTVVYDREGHVVRRISITPIPNDRPPFPTPEAGTFPTYFTVQPGGAILETNPAVAPAGARIVYPNTAGHPPGVEADFWSYEPQGGVRWYRYGVGRVSDRGTEFEPGEGMRVHKFTMHALISPNLIRWVAEKWANLWAAVFGGDPVDLSTGLFVLNKTDLAIADVLPLALTRTYRPGDTVPRAFGIGANHNYGLFLYSENGFVTISLVLAGGERVRYERTSSGTGYSDAVLEHTDAPSPFHKSVLRYVGPYPGTWTITLRDGTVYRFVYNGDLASITDRFGNAITLTRELIVAPGFPYPVPWGKIQRITGPSGRWIDLTYDDSQTRIVQAIDHQGRTVGYVYDASGRLWKVIDAAGGVTEYTYDGSHRMLTIKDARGIVFLTNEYDANSRVTKQTQADATTYQFAYTVDGAGKVTQTDLTNPRGYVRRLTFNAAGYPLTDTHAHGQTQAQTVTYTRQTGTNFILTATDALSRETALTYDGQGNVASVTRLAGTLDAVTTSFTHETPGTGAFNRLTSLTTPIATTSLAYNDTSRTITITDPLSHATVITHNTRGQVATIANALSHTTTFSYDTQNNLTGITDPLSTQTTRAYDGYGRLIRQTDPRGNVTVFSYNALNQLTTIADAQQGTTRFTYDANGNLLSVTDAKGNATTYTYSNMDRVTTRTDPLTRQETYSYDNNGNPTTVTDRKSQATTLAYDPLDRLTSRTYADSSTIAYTYDAANRLTQVVDSIAGTITLGHDDLDRLLSEATPNGTVEYTYDDLGRRLTMDVPGQAQISYAWDDANRLLTITQGSNVVTFDYDNANRRTKLTYPSGTSTEYAYDNGSRLTGLTYKHGGSTLGAVTYTYDLASQRTQVGGSWARTNRPNALASATYNAGNQQTAFGGQTLTYDLNGNLTGDGTNTYTWNARNQLASLSGPVPGSFVYDAFGRRQRKTIDGTITDFVYDGLNPVREAVGAGTVDLLTGLGIDDYLTRTDSSGTRQLLTDALGSTVSLSDSSGTVQTEYSYEPFGTATVSGSTSTNELRYTGREEDSTNLNYYRARYYHPGLARFIAEDPIGLAGGDTNFYAYVLNQPTGLVDPTGLEPITVSTGLAIGIVCAAGAVAADSVVIAVNGRKTTWQQLAVATGVGCGGGVAVLGAYAAGVAVSVGPWLDGIISSAMLSGSVAVAGERVLASGQRALIMSDHALTQMYRRGITWQTVEDTIGTGKTFPYVHKGVQGLRGFEWVSR
jgi:RHS repeat-associated protein